MTPILRAAAVAATLGLSAGAAASATLATVVPGDHALSGPVEYAFDPASGFGEAFGPVFSLSAFIDYDLFVAGNVDFSPVASGGLPVPDYSFGAPSLTVVAPPASGDTDTLLTGDLVDYEVGAGFLTLLFEIVAADGDFAGFMPFAIVSFSDPDFPALLGAYADVEVFEALAPVPLPAAAPLMLAGLALLGVAARRRR